MVNVSGPSDATATLERAVLAALDDHGATALELAKHMLSSRADMNRILYQLEREGRVSKTEGSPPRWFRTKTSPSAVLWSSDQAGHRLHIAIDLGNSHDILPKVIDGASKGRYTVSAYADFAYNGYGVNPPVTAENVSVFAAPVMMKQLADAQLLWDMCLLAHKWNADSQRPARLFVASKDTDLLPLTHLVPAINPLFAVRFVNGWTQLEPLLAEAVAPVRAESSPQAPRPAQSRHWRPPTEL